MPTRVSSIGALARGAASSTTNTPGPDVGTGRPHGTGPSASSPTARRSPGAVPSIVRMVQTTAKRYRSGPMTSRPSAARRSRRLVTALFVALLAFTGTVAVVSWPRSTPVPVSAALPTAGDTQPAGTLPEASPAPSREIAGGGAELPASAPPNPDAVAPVVPTATPPAGGGRARCPGGARPEAADAPEQAPVEVRDPRRLGVDHPGRRVHLDRDQRIRERAQEDPRRGRHGIRARERQQDLYVGPDHGPRRRGEAGSRHPRIDDPAQDPDRGKGDRPPAARPHERAARLFPQRQDRSGAVR